MRLPETILILIFSLGLSEHPVTRASVEEGSPEQWALLIAYDERGLILAHEDCYIDTQSLEKECSDWNERRQKRAIAH